MMRIRERALSGAIRRGVRLAALVSLVVAGIATSIQSEEAVEAPSAPGRIEFVGKNFFSTANGTFHVWRIVESRFDPDSPETAFAVVEVDLASVDTSSDARDDHLRTDDFFDVENHPVAIVRAHSLVAKGQSPAGHPLFEVEFDVDLHGVERTLRGEVEVVDESPTVLEGRLVVNRLEFEVGPPESRWNPMSIGAEIPVRFRVEI